MEEINELREKVAQYERREKEHELRLEELNDFVENASISLHWLNADGIITWANQTELDAMGYPREEYIGRHMADFHADEHAIKDILDRLSKNETLQNYPARLKCRDGSIKHVRINSNVFWKDNKFIHTRCFTRDVTEFVKDEQRKAEILVELEESEERLRMAIESTHLGTWEYSPLTGDLKWSKECRKIYGISPDDAINFEIFSKHIHPDDSSLVQQAIAEAMDAAGSGTYDITYRILRFDDNSTRWIRAQGKVYLNKHQEAERFIGTVVDITESKLNSEKIARSEKLFRSIALNIPKSLVIVMDKDHRFVTIEGDIMEKMGFNSKDYEGKHPVEVGPPERYEATRHLYDRVLAGEKFSVERKGENGEDFMVHFVPLKNDKDEVENALIIALEITDIKQAEEGSAKLAAIVQSSDDAIISKSLDSIITSWNDSAERTFGYTADEIIGKSVLLLIPPERRDEEPQIISRLKNGERVEHFETQRITKDNTLLDISLTISPVKDSMGNIIGVSKIARDITEKKRAAKLLNEREEHLGLAIKAADLGTFDLDMVNGTMVWDKRCREFFGIYNNEPVNYNDDFLNGLHPDDRERVTTLIDNLFDRSKSNGIYDVEYRTVGVEDQKLRWVRAMGKVYFDDDGKPVRFIGTVLDITDKKQAELRKNDFIAMVSHELKTPLTSVRAYIQVLLADAKKRDEKFAINALTRTEVQTKKMASMIQDFLSLARLEEGKIQITKEKFKLHELIEEISGDAQFLTSTHTIKLKDCDDINIYGDRDKIGQVLINLLSNAIKYSPGGGSITIGCEVTGNKVKIYVSDEGIGISLSDQEKLFDRFYRVRNEKIKTISGFGIGLYLVSELLSYHDSKIEVESVEGHGSTFYFLMDVC